MRHIRPRQNGDYWISCDMFDEDMPEYFRACWCQSGEAAGMQQFCQCVCHEDSNSRSVYK